MRRRMGGGVNAQSGGQGELQQGGQTFPALGAAGGEGRFGGQGFGGAAATGLGGGQGGLFRREQPAQGGFGATMQGFEDQIIDGSAERES